MEEHLMRVRRLAELGAEQYRRINIARVAEYRLLGSSVELIAESRGREGGGAQLRLTNRKRGCADSPRVP